MTWKVIIKTFDKRGTDLAGIHPTNSYNEQHH